MSGVGDERVCGLSTPRGSGGFGSMWTSHTYPHAAATARQRAEDPTAVARVQDEMTVGLVGGTTRLVSHDTVVRAANRQRWCRVFSDRAFEAALNGLSVTAES